MIGSIDLKKKPRTPRVYLARPNGTVIAHLKESYGLKHNLKLGGIHELSFNLPYEIDRGNTLIRNPHIDEVREKYLIKLTLGTAVEWYEISAIKESGGDSSDAKEVTAMFLPYELRGKLHRVYDTETSGPKNLTSVATDALASTLWTVGYVDASFDVVYRSFSLASVTALDFLFQIATTFQALIVWDSVARTVSFYKQENVGTNRGLTVSYSKYLKTLSKTVSADELVTRLKVFGKDNISIYRLNPTGTDYLEDFSFFLYPFQRDAGRVVTQSSYYMTDNLCHAILDYQALVEANRGTFAGLVTQKDAKLVLKSTAETELFAISTDLAVAKDNVDVQQADGSYNSTPFAYSGSTTTKTLSLKANRKHAVMVYVSDMAGKTVKIGGATKTVVSDTWTVLSKESVTTTRSVSVVVSGTGTADVQLISMSIADAEFTAIGNEAAILKKYNAQYEQKLYDAKTASIAVIVSDITAIDAQITTLRASISIEANFTVNQIKERNLFVIEKEWVDQNYILDTDLYEDAKKKFDLMKTPQTVIDIDVVNFLEVLEAQHDWDKLALGDTITIKYEKFNLNVKAKIIEITFDYESADIKLVIANVKDIESDDDNVIKMLYKSNSTSATVDMNKYKWSETVRAVGEVGAILNSRWDAVKRGIDAGVNNSVSIDARGISVRDSADPSRFLRITNGILGITNDSGNSYKHAITADGIIGERIFGQIFTGNNLIIGDADGIFKLMGNKGVVYDRLGTEVMKLGLYDTVTGVEKFGLQLVNPTTRVTVDKDTGFEIARKTGATWDTVAWLDVNGKLNLKDIIASGTIEATTLSATTSLKVNNIDVTDLITNGLQMNTDWIKANQIDANAITAKHTITGATLQTATSGARVVVNSSGLTAYNVAGVSIFSIVNGNINMATGSITWGAGGVNAPTSSQVGAKPASYSPTYSEITAVYAPTAAEVNAAIGPNRLTKIDSAGIYTGTMTTNQLVAGSALIGNALIDTISANKITTGTMSADRITGGTIIGVTINVSTDATIGDNLILNKTNFGGGVQWGPTSSKAASVYIDPAAGGMFVANLMTGGLHLDAPGGVFAGAQRLDQPIIAKFG